MNKSVITLHSLPTVSTRGKKRAGRGYGSGKGGHTSGRGQKGQRSRRTIPWSFEGGALPLSQRLPFWRGKGRLNPLKPKPALVNVGQLEKLKAGAVVDATVLVTEGILSEKEVRTQGVKILGRGKLTKKLTIVGLAVSAPARIKIEKVEGKIEERAEMDKATETVKTAKVIKKVESVKEKKVTRPVEAKKKPETKTSKKITKKTSPKKKTTTI